MVVPKTHFGQLETILQCLRRARRAVGGRDRGGGEVSGGDVTLLFVFTSFV